MTDENQTSNDAPERVPAMFTAYSDNTWHTLGIRSDEVGTECLTQQLSGALIAAAYRDAAKGLFELASEVIDIPDGWEDLLSEATIYITPEESAAALDELLAEARIEGMERAAEIAKSWCSSSGLQEAIRAGIKAMRERNDGSNATPCRD